jgi:polar amino acid transport system ATP-binding protein
VTGAGAAALVELRSVAVELAGKPVLRDISLAVARGERLALIGPSGSGKSTVLRCINGLLRPRSGSVGLFGRVMATPRDWRAARLRMETIFQDYALYSHMDTLANVSLAPRHLLGKSKAEAEAIAMRCLQTFGVADLARKWVDQLSGGQRQRIAMARALAKSPEVLLLDEPTAALDPENVSGALRVIEQAAATGMAMICVTHELGFMRRFADRVLFIDGGLVVESGPPAEVLSQPATDRLRRFLAARS